MTLLLRLTLISHTIRELKWLQPYRKSCIIFNRSKYSKHMLDGVLLALVFMTGFYLLARTQKGSCPKHATVWVKQSCNPFADASMIPVEQALVLIVSIPLFQIFIKGGTYRTLSLAWFISVLMVNIGNYLASSAISMYIWTNAGFLVMISISYEMERTILVSFINLVLLRKAQEERHTMRATIDGNTKDLLVRIHIIANASDDINGSLNGAFANIDILQQKLAKMNLIMEKSTSLVPQQQRREVHIRACTNLTMIKECLQNAVKSVDDLKVLYKIIEPEALQWQRQDRLRRTTSLLNKKRVGKKREVVFDGDKNQSNHVYQGSQEVSSGVHQKQSDDNDDNDDDDNVHECKERDGEGAELVSIHSSKHSTSYRPQPSQQQSSLNKESMEMVTIIATSNRESGSTVHATTVDRDGHSSGLGIDVIGGIFSALTDNASVGHYSSITGISLLPPVSPLFLHSPIHHLPPSLPPPTHPCLHILHSFIHTQKHPSGIAIFPPATAMVICGTSPLPHAPGSS